MEEKIIQPTKFVPLKPAKRLLQNPVEVGERE